MNALVWLGVALLVLWCVLWLGFHIVVGLVHLLLILAAVFIVWGLVRRGARAVSNRL